MENGIQQSKLRECLKSYDEKIKNTQTQTNKKKFVNFKLF